MKRLTAIALARGRALISASVLCLGISVCRGDWVRFSAGRPTDNKTTPIGLTDISETAGGLSASAWLQYVEGSDRITLHGARDSNGDFRPTVDYEVSIEDKTKWKNISVKRQQAGVDTITVDSEHRIVALRFDMEPFRSLVGLHRYGRLVLENGNSVVFPTDDLLPTSGEADNNGDFHISVLQSEEEKRKKGFSQLWLNSPITFSYLTSFKGGLTGDFIFGNHGKDEVTLEGYKTSDGDFFPKVTLQAGNSDRDWTTLKEPENKGTLATLRIPKGKAEVVRVLLTDYKQVTGKYKYGRVIFADGEWVIFSLELLSGTGSK